MEKNEDKKSNKIILEKRLLIYAYNIGECPKTFWLWSMSVNVKEGKIKVIRDMDEKRAQQKAF